MPLSKALQILVKKGHLKPLELRPLSNPLPAKHDATQYCAYHQQTGHNTDNCFRLRHEVQGLIDNEVIHPPSSAKVEPPAGGARLTPDVAFGTHCFEHLQMLMPDCAQRAEDGSFHKSTKIDKNAKSQKGGKKKTLLKDNRVPIHNTRGKFSPPFDGLLHRQRTAAILLDSDDFRISKPFDMDKATLLPLRGSLGRKPERVTQAKGQFSFISEVAHLKSRCSVFSPLSTYLPERALYLPEKGTIEANNKRPKSSLILQAARYQAKCEAQTGMEQDISFPYLDRSDHVQTPQQSIISRCQLQICCTSSCIATPLWGSSLL
ncbi:hypothetical protein CsSME_00001663 [Camellia sinensis var. sinensis]